MTYNVSSGTLSLYTATATFLNFQSWRKPAVVVKTSLITTLESRKESLQRHCTQLRIQYSERGFVTAPPVRYLPFPFLPLLFPTFLPCYLYPAASHRFHPLSLPPITTHPRGPSPFRPRGLGERYKLPQQSPGWSSGHKSNIWPTQSPENASGGKDLSHSSVVQNAYGSPCIMWSSTPVMVMKFDLQKL